MKKAILVITFIIATISSFSQTLFFDNLDNTTWIATEKSKEASITNSKEIALVKLRTPTDSLKQNTTCWRFNGERGLVTIIRFNSRFKNKIESGTYSYETNVDKGILSINIPGRLQQFKVGISSTGNFALLMRHKQKSGK